MLGRRAVAEAEKGNTKCMMTLNRISNTPYKCEIGYAGIDHIANEAKSVPREWINEAGNDITPALLEYLAPLIIGEPDIQYKNGLPVYLPVNHLDTGK